MTAQPAIHVTTDPDAARTVCGLTKADLVLPPRKAHLATCKRCIKGLRA